MPEDIRLRIGAFVATIPLVGTPAQIAAALQDFFEEQGISQEGTEVERMTRFLEYLQTYVRNKSKGRRTKKVEAATQVTNQAQVDSEISF